ncbi:MAG: type II toxin-antitoxin system HicB family antitoxin [Acidaminococcaceae bacterium]|nr:type II toxin-antitoxin system HicB family antitoxin [Acidaminococcaceae bacterium]
MTEKYLDNYIFPAIIEKAADTYGVYFKDLPGCIATGSTMHEAVAEAKQALALHLWGMEQDKEPIPTPGNIEEISLEANEILCLLDINMFQIRAKMNNTPVKKTLTIPWYLNKLGEERRINFSQLLQNALKEKLGLL